jgi:hypothetical protein
MRHLFLLSTLLALVTGCPSTNPVECRDQSSCDLSPGGLCVSSPTGNQWCAYPDATCPGGMRYSDDRVGDGLAGTCVVADDDVDASQIDAATDAAVDATPIDGNGVVDPVVIAHGTSPSSDVGTSIAPMGSGFVVGGTIGAETNFGGGPRIGPRFVARFDFDGGHVWSRGFNANAALVASDSSGNAVLGGNFTQPFTLGGSGDTLTPMVVDGYLAKLTNSNGNHLWSKRLGGVDSDLVTTIGVFSNGDVLAAGTFRGSINLGGSALTATGSATNTFVARFASADGAHVWSVALVGTQNNGANAVAVDANGDVLVAGFFRGAITVDGTNHSSAGEIDGFVAKLNGSTGARIWSNAFGGNGFDTFTTVTPGSDGSVIVAGQYGAAFTFGSMPLGHVAMADGLVGKLNGATGAAVWATGFGSAGIDSVRGVADVAGQVVVGAEFAQTVMFGTQMVNPVGNVDVLVGRLNLTTGAPAGAVRFGSTEPESLGQLVGAGNFYLFTGGFQGAVDFGIATLNAPGTNNSDVFAGMLLP